MVNDKFRDTIKGGTLLLFYVRVTENKVRRCFIIWGPEYQLSLVILKQEKAYLPQACEPGLHAEHVRFGIIAASKQSVLVKTQEQTELSPLLTGASKLRSITTVFNNVTPPVFYGNRPIIQALHHLNLERYLWMDGRRKLLTTLSSISVQLKFNA
ncbi:hypothetical protein HUJ04_004481 [Dendroctonus ponderosae]|nr:hypothetical protein HUJ04_004481 [Dendroctonus ponderosae]